MRRNTALRHFCGRATTIVEIEKNLSLRLSCDLYDDRTTFTLLETYNRKIVRSHGRRAILRWLHDRRTILAMVARQFYCYCLYPYDSYDGRSIFTILTMVARPSCDLINGFYWKQVVAQLSIIARRSHDVFKVIGNQALDPVIKHDRS